MDLDSYYKKGYVLSPFYSERDVKNFKKVKTKILTKTDIRTIIVGSTKDNYNLLYSEEELMLVKYNCRYHITPKDILERIDFELKEKSNDYDSLIAWSYFLELTDDNGPVYTPFLNEEYYEKNKKDVEDYLFNKDDHIVSYIVRLIRNELKKEKYLETLKTYSDFIKDILDNRQFEDSKKAFNIKTKSLIVDAISFELWLGRKISKKCLSFYKDTLKTNAESNDIPSMRLLGYEYYEGTNGFPLDSYKALYWLEKYFNETKDPDVARTLGYIYYYGRTTNGIPQGDKAFQYFAIGHLAGHYLEATYKLADCYIHGYGTPVCHQAAFNLVSSIYDETLNYFLRGEDTKFADITLRMGNYYKDGIYVEKNLYKSLFYYLEAKCAIKKRLEHMEYIGDRNVAMSISLNLDKIESELKVENRVIKDGGYLITDEYFSFPDMKYDIKFKDNHIFISIKRNTKLGQKYFLTICSRIGFVERAEEVKFKLKPLDEESAEGFVNSINERKIKNIEINEDKIYALVDIGDREYFNSFTTFEELIFYPQSTKNPAKQYTVVSVQYENSKKLYDYIAEEDDIKVGDIKTISTEYGYSEVVVKTIKYLYEDQLPLPYSKMDKL